MVVDRSRSSGAADGPGRFLWSFLLVLLQAPQWMYQGQKRMVSFGGASQPCPLPASCGAAGKSRLSPYEDCGILCFVCLFSRFGVVIDCRKGKKCNEVILESWKNSVDSPRGLWVCTPNSSAVRPFSNSEQLPEGPFFHSFLQEGTSILQV